MHLDPKILSSIKRQIKFKAFLTFLCVATIILSAISFFFYGFGGVNKAIRLITSKDNLKLEKVMVNPKIQFEHSDGRLFNIKATKAIHKERGDIEMFGVVVDGDIGQISSGNLLVTNGGNNLHFSNNPLLIIKEVQK